MRLYGIPILVLVLLFSQPVQAAVVFTDTGDGIQRPTQVLDVIVGGEKYDVTITYNIPINVVTPQTIGDLPDTDANNAALELAAIINAAAVAQGIDSNETIIHLLGNNQPPAMQSLARLDDQSVGVGDFMTELLPAPVLIAARVDRGVASFQIAPSPEPSTLLACGTLGLVAMWRRRRSSISKNSHKRVPD